MNRLAFAGGLVVAGVLTGRAALAHPTTIVAVACNVSTLEDDAEDFLAGALTERDVATLDPSAIDVTYHEQARLDAARLLDDSVSVDYASLVWVTAVYHAERLLVANALVNGSSLPYEGFTVYNARARCSYRCFDVVSKRIVAAGSTLGTSRSEDADEAGEDAMHDGLSAIAKEAAPALR
ncbi:MAG TPA: hypothetical protein VME66_12375 [Candidatus Acidoferrales bacterium]|nr:hypothetical protein [Candidatus Acidoferrales bacterium]